MTLPDQMFQAKSVTFMTILFSIFSFSIMVPLNTHAQSENVLIIPLHQLIVTGRFASVLPLITISEELVVIV